jgi:hypothetical protein
MKEDPVITEASELIKAHQFQQAAYLLSGFLQKNPLSQESITAWLLMAKLVDSTDKQIDCLQRVLQIDPKNATALEILKQVMQEKAITVDASSPIMSESGAAEDAVQVPQEKPFIGLPDKNPDAIVSPQSAFASAEVLDLGVYEIPPEIKTALEQVKSIEEYFEETEIVTEKFQGTEGPDFRIIQELIRERVSAGYILQAEEYTPQKVFGKPEVILTFAKPKEIFKRYCHKYPYVCNKYNSQESYLEFNLENVLGEHLAYVYRSLEKRDAGLELLRILSLDHNQVRFEAVIREMDEDHQVIDLYRGKQEHKIGEIMRNRKEPSENVNAAFGMPLLSLVDHSGKDPKRVVFTIQKQTSLLRYQIHTFDFSTREMLIRVGDPHLLPEDEEAVVLMTGLLAVDYMI